MYSWFFKVTSSIVSMTLALSPITDWRYESESFKVKDQAWNINLNYYES